MPPKKNKPVQDKEKKDDSKDLRRKVTSLPVGADSHKTIVLCIGSKYVRFGMAHDRTPQHFPAVIARRKLYPKQIATEEADDSSRGTKRKRSQVMVLDDGLIKLWEVEETGIPNEAPPTLREKDPMELSDPLESKETNEQIENQEKICSEEDKRQMNELRALCAEIKMKNTTILSSPSISKMPPLASADTMMYNKNNSFLGSCPSFLASFDGGDSNTEEERKEGKKRNSSWSSDELNDTALQLLSGRHNAIVGDAAEQASVYLTPVSMKWVRSQSSLRSLPPAPNVGDDDLMVGVSIHQPIRCGYLNFEGYENAEGLRNDIVALILEACRRIVGCKTEQETRKALSSYKVMFGIPDLFDRDEVVFLVELLMTQIGFSAVMVHQESVLAAFGSGVTSCCVVDIGHEKTSIACIVDGVSQRMSRFHMPFGGKDVTQLLTKMFSISREHYWPFTHCDLSYLLHERSMEIVKESMCGCFPRCVTKAFEIECWAKNGKSISFYGGNASDALLLAPHSLFRPAVFNRPMSKCKVAYNRTNVTDEYERYYDHFVIFYESFDATQKSKVNNIRHPQQTNPQVKQTPPQPVKSSPVNSAPKPVSNPNSNNQKTDSPSSLKKKAEDEEDENNEDGDEEEEEQHNDTSETAAAQEPVETLPEVEKRFLNTDIQPIHLVIQRSILRCGKEDQLKMLGNILLAGGSTEFEGFDGLMNQRLKSLLPPTFDDVVSIVASPRDITRSDLSWRGGSVIAMLDQSSDCWVTQQGWTQRGVRELREKCAFRW